MNAPVEQEAKVDLNTANEAKTRTLLSGRSVVLKQAGNNEEVEIRSPEGTVEVVITLTDNGPVVRLSGARLELNATEELAVNCGRLAIHTRADAEIDSQGSVRIHGKDMCLEATEVMDLMGVPVAINLKDRKYLDKYLAERKRRSAESE